MIHVRTPATTANMGSGFDSIGMALKLYNNLWAEERDENELEIRIAKEQSISIPTTANNLIYRTMADFYKTVGKKVPGFLLIQEDSIPLTRGLGSSAACIVSGLIAANSLSGANLSKDDLIAMAAKIEGHPDNSTPAFLGGIVVGALSDKDFKYVQMDAPDDLQFAVMIPSFTLSTEKARRAIPKLVTHKDAVFNVSRTGLLIASLMTRKYDNLNMAMDDRLHQPYRKSIVPGMEAIFKKAKEYGSKSVFLSGAGPTIIAAYHNNDTFLDNMNRYLYGLKGGWELNVIEPDNMGAILEYDIDYMPNE